MIGSLLVCAACSGPDIRPDSINRAAQDSAPRRDLTAECIFDTSLGEYGTLVCEDGTRAAHAVAPRAIFDPKVGGMFPCEFSDDEDGSVRMSCRDAQVRLDGSCESFDGDLMAYSPAIGEALFRAGCTEISGALVVTLADDLEQYSRLEAIGGGLYLIGNPALKNVSGLSGLRAIGGDLTIELNPALSDLGALAGLRSVSKTLRVAGNTALGSLDGLANLKHIGEALHVVGQPRLGNERVHALLKLAQDKAGSMIWGNEALTARLGGESCGVEDQSGGRVLVCEDHLFMPLSDSQEVSARASAARSFCRPSVDKAQGFRCAETPLPANGSCEVFAGDFKIAHPLDLIALSRAGCATIDGNLSIESPHALAELAGLSQLKEITGTLKIANNARLGGLRGLGALETIGRDLTVRDNASLRSLAGLTSLKSKIRSLSITRNMGLVTLDGFADIESIERFFYVDYNPNLRSLQGLSGVDMRRLKSVSVEHNLQLKDLRGLEGLASTLTPALSRLRIAGNNSLGSMKGLERLESVGKLDIEDNAALLSLDGLEGLRSVRERLVIRQNPALRDIDALSGLEGLESVMIHANRSLPTEDIQRWVATFKPERVTLTPTITHNAGADTTVCRLEGDGRTLRLICDGETHTELSIPDGYAQVDPNFDLDTCEVSEAQGAVRQVSCGGEAWGTLPARCDLWVGSARNKKVIWVAAQAGCAVIDGSVRVDFPTPEAHFAGLQKIRSISGNLGTDPFESDEYSRKEPLSTGADFAQFSGLQELNGYLLLIATEMRDLSAFSQLRILHGKLFLDRNERLISTKGLNNVRLIGKGLLVIHNPKLKALEGFESLESVGGLSIAVNRSLKELGALESLRSIRGDVSFSDNPRLSECAARKWLEGRTGDHGVRLLGLNKKLGCPKP